MHDRVIQEYVAIHEMGKKRKSTCSICVGGPGRLPAPSPLLRWRSPGGGGGLAGRVQPGDLSREGGIFGKQAGSWNGRFFWRVNSADYSRGWIRQIFMARYFGGSVWRIYLAGHFGAFTWRVFIVNEISKTKEKEKKCTISESVSCIMPLYVASNIMLFCSRYRFYWTS